MSTRILILKTGEFPRRMIARVGPVEQAFLDVLGAEHCVVVDARTDRLPAVDWDGVVVTGSAASANDPDMWVARSEDFLKRAADASVPLYGVCFGHQHLARTFGGRVEKNPAGWELGTASVTLTEAGRRDTLFTALPETFSAQQSHGEVVVELPPGARALAFNAQTAYQAFALGDAIWGTQFHPEFTPDIVCELISLLTVSLPAACFPAWPADEQPLQDWLLKRVHDTPAARRCLENFATLVQRPPPGHKPYPRTPSAVWRIRQDDLPPTVTGADRRGAAGRTSARSSPARPLRHRRPSSMPRCAKRRATPLPGV